MFIQLDESNAEQQTEKNGEKQTQKSGLQEKIEVYTKQYMKEASKVVENAFTDNAEGASERAEEKAYMWTKLKTDLY